MVAVVAAYPEAWGGGRGRGGFRGGRGGGRHRGGFGGHRGKRSADALADPEAAAEADPVPCRGCRGGGGWGGGGYGGGGYGGGGYGGGGYGGGYFG